MKKVNIIFEFAKDCPYNLYGTCINSTIRQTDCGIGKKLPPKYCPLPEAPND